jgi:hypothetical protein
MMGNQLLVVFMEKFLNIVKINDNLSFFGLFVHLPIASKLGKWLHQGDQTLTLGIFIHFLFTKVVNFLSSKNILDIVNTKFPSFLKDI